MRPTPLKAPAGGVKAGLIHGQVRCLTVGPLGALLQTLGVGGLPAKDAPKDAVYKLGEAKEAKEPEYGLACAQALEA